MKTAVPGNTRDNICNAGKALRRTGGQAADAMRMDRFRVLFAAVLLLLVCNTEGGAAAFRYEMHHVGNAQIPAMGVVGYEMTHVVGPKQTLLDIARQYGLGYNELRHLYPHVDPWLPPEGMVLAIPRTWALPPTRHEAVVVNIAEMRLYHFFPAHQLVRTYPVGIGRQGFATPTGVTRVVTRETHPEWTVPEDSRQRVGRAVVPPGPDNPLGDYWIGLAAHGIGIHGTNFPWGIGRRVSHGCIRMYPEHVETFFNDVLVGTRVEIIYEPVKTGLQNNTIFLEVHPDIYGIVPDMYDHAASLLRQRGLFSGVDRQRMRRVVAARRGVPEAVGTVIHPQLTMKQKEAGK